MPKIMKKHIKILDDCIKIAKGCHDYQGGYHNKEDHEIFHHGIQTVINSLDKFKQKGLNDFQVAALHSIGNNSKHPTKEKTI